MSLHGKVALVTGASRGIGRGIASVLAQEGAKVYITGRPKGGNRSDGQVGDLQKTAKELSEAAAPSGGACVAVACDHGDDAQTERVVKELFAQEGRLDVLVNNAFQGLDSSTQFGDITAAKFWEKPVQHWDLFHRVGLRSHYVALAFCAREWVARKQKALVVNVSSAAGAGYVFDVAYGVGKAGVDRLTADTAKELKPHGVAVVSLWPGAVATEAVQGFVSDKNHGVSRDKNFSEMESVEFSGRGVAALAKDPDVMRWSGRIAMTPELAEEYSFTDVDGKVKWGVFLKDCREQVMSRPPRHWLLPAPARARL